jgi:hypothetical protein
MDFTDPEKLPKYASQIDQIRKEGRERNETITNLVALLLFHSALSPNLRVPKLEIADWMTSLLKKVQVEKIAIQFAEVLYYASDEEQTLKGKSMIRDRIDNLRSKSLKYNEGIIETLAGVLVDMTPLVKSVQEPLSFVERIEGFQKDFQSNEVIALLYANALLNLRMLDPGLKIGQLMIEKITKLQQNFKTNEDIASDLTEAYVYTASKVQSASEFLGIAGKLEKRLGQGREGKLQLIKTYEKFS